MGTYFNPGNEIFQHDVNSKIYVDKTGLIGYVNSILLKADRYICVSRPRRFGKSFAADMLTAYYSRGCKSRKLFKGSLISKNVTYKKHLNKYNVIHIDVGGFLDSLGSSVNTCEAVEILKRDILSEIKHAYPKAFVSRDDLILYLGAVYQKSGNGFVFIIDEWDAPFRINKNDVDGQTEYLRFLNALLKGKDYVVLAYMTGILPIKKYSTGSVLNMFSEYTMLRPGPVKEYIGFTEEEVERLCQGSKFTAKDIKDWYDGYNLDGLEVYNSNSVVSALKEGELTSYWTKTDAFEDLLGYVKEDRFGIHRVILDLLSEIKHDADFSGYMNDLVTINNLDDILAILVHLGYLAFDRKLPEKEDGGNVENGRNLPGDFLTDEDVIKGKTKSDGTVRIPNREIREEFLTILKNLGSYEAHEFERLSAKIVSLTIKGESTEDMETLAECIERVHDEYVSDTQNYNTEDSLSNTVRLAFFAVINDFYSRTEASSSRGRADVVFTPRKGRMYLPMVVEFKMDDTAENAIKQIKDKRYYKTFYEYIGDVILLGIVYDSKTKKHVVKKEVITVDNTKLL